MKKFKQARVNGGSNYDSLKVGSCQVFERDMALPASLKSIGFGSLPNRESSIPIFLFGNRES